MIQRLNVDISFDDGAQLLLEAGSPGLDKPERSVETLKTALAKP
jgi:hypothetical protein